MALYQITVDCRIANKDYKRGDVVSGQEVEYFPSVMSPIGENKKVETPVAPAPVKAPEEPTEEVESTEEVENTDEVEDEGETAEEEAPEEPEEEEEEKIRKKSAKKSKKK